MSLVHGQIETKTIRVGGRIVRQEKFYCAVHGWFDLLVFPNSERDHEQCREHINHGAAFEELQTFKMAA